MTLVGSYATDFNASASLVPPARGLLVLPRNGATSIRARTRVRGIVAVLGPYRCIRVEPFRVARLRNIAGATGIDRSARIGDRTAAAPGSCPLEPQDAGREGYRDASRDRGAFFVCRTPEASAQRIAEVLGVWLRAGRVNAGIADVERRSRMCSACLPLNPPMPLAFAPRSAVAPPVRARRGRRSAVPVGGQAALAGAGRRRLPPT